MTKVEIKKIAKIFVAFLLVVTIIICGINLYILHCEAGYTFNQISDVPQQDVALVMGTDLLRFDGSTNLHFLNRTEAAAMLYSAGKAKRLLITGNRNNKGFNEVDGMEREISAKGVPKDDFILDYSGNTTWESLRRAVEVYHIEKIIIVTDDFHAPRAIYLSHHFGIEAVAFCYGSESSGFWTIRYHVREWFARVKAFFQVLFDKGN